jgi:Leucine-rich repeat (LRR) protein
MFVSTIPASIGNLSSLRTLYLQNNLFESVPDAFFSNLTSLIELDLAYNQIDSTIPETIGNMIELRNLALNSNYFRSSIPAAIGRLINLDSIDLSYNNDITGSFPSELFAMRNLTNILFTTMGLSGTLPDNFTALPSLKSINIAYNHFFGYLPASIGNCSQLVNFELLDNLFDGTIPRSFEGLHRMVAFYFEANSFTGSLDPLIGMHALTLSQGNVNFFNGTIDQVFNHLNHTNEFDLANNLFTGPLPCNPHWKDIYLYEFYTNYFDAPLSDCFQNITKIHNFIAYNNFIPGPLPDPFCPSAVLTYLTIETNVLSGPLPASLMQLHGLLQLFLSNNFLTRTIPDTIGSMQRLVILSLSNNSMTGTLPAALSHVKYLQEIFLQSNAFTGNLDHFDNSSLFHDLNNIDLSNNRFTGRIPVNFFRLNSSLQSVSLSKNCFYGSIPEELCLLQNLTSLSLDGLSTSVNCQAPDIFQGPFSFIRSFEVTHFMKSSIPSCLYELPKIQLIHLSGNGLTGSIPSSVTISSTLTDLSLSHNELTGTIPLIFQRKDDWNNLDLSYNKLTGTLDDSFHPFNAESSLSLEINRLSGSIPQSIINMTDISILSENIFSCQLLNPSATLPVHDSDYSNYSCGSDNVNIIIFAWLILIFLVPSILLCLARFTYLQMSWKDWKRKLWNRENFRVSRKFSLVSLSRQSDQIVLNDLSTAKSTADEESSVASSKSKTNISRLFEFFEELRSFFLLISLFILFILLPVYSALKGSFSSYQFEYAWTISGLLLSGETAGICLFVFLSLFIVFILVLVDRHVEWITPRESSTSAPLHGTSDDHSSLFLEYLIYAIIFLANAAVMGIVDFSYVYIVLNYSYTVATLSALFLAVFRILTNNIVLFNAIPFLWKLLRRAGIPPAPSSTLEQEEEGSRYFSYEHSPRDISFLQQLVLLNNILIPILAVIFILPDCFYYLLFQPPSVTSSYSYVSCKEYFPTIDAEHICEPETESVTYTPAFSYSYQCSSKIAINYVPVYLLMFLFIGLVVPLYRLILKILHDLLKSEPTDQNNPANPVAPWKDIARRVIEHLMTSRAKDLPVDRPGSSSSRPVLFHKLQFTVQMNSYLAICITFGGLFPPLAFIACLSILTTLAFEEFSLKDLLARSRSPVGMGISSGNWCEEQLESECKQTASAFALTIWTAVLVACGLYGYVIFDTIGDTAGWAVALPFTLVMLVVPLLFLLGKKVFSSTKTSFFLASSPPAAARGQQANDGGPRGSEVQMVQAPTSLVHTGPSSPSLTENPILLRARRSSDIPRTDVDP